MRIIDRYIARQYATNIALLLVLLFSFVVMVDASLNMHRFWRLAGERLSRGGAGEPGLIAQTGASLYLVADLWGPRLLQLFNYLLGVVLVGAMGFTCSQMVRHRELVALLASGQSLYRAARPIIAVAVVMTLLQAANHELLLPRVAHLLTRDHRDAGNHEMSASKVPLVPDGRGRLFHAADFDPEAGRMTGLYVIERDADGYAARRISAASAVWSAGRWNLHNAEVRETDKGGRATPPVRHAALAIETDLDPTALKMQRFTAFGQSLSWRQLSEMRRRLDAAGTEEAARTAERLDRVRFGRLSSMACNILTLLVALPMFLTREPRNMLVQSLKGAPVGLAAILAGSMGTSVAVPGVPPWLSVFIPLIVLVPAAAVMLNAIGRRT